RGKENSSLPEPDQTTDAEGRFTLSGFLPDERVAVTVTHRERRLAAHFRHDLPADGKKPVPMEGILYPMATLTGGVLGDDNKPLAGAIVWLCGSELSDARSYPVVRLASTDAEGRFAVGDLVSGVSYFAKFTAEGFTEHVTFPGFTAEAGKTHRMPDL